MFKFLKKIGQASKKANNNSATDKTVEPTTTSHSVVVKKLAQQDFAMPIEGEIIPLSEVPDDVFAKEMMGPGFGIIPTGDTLYSPVNGKIMSLFPTKHAIGIETDTGVEILIHVGIDTVKLKGVGFELLIEDGQLLQRGDALLKLDLPYIGANTPSIITPIIFTNVTNKQLHILKNGIQPQGETSILMIDDR